MNVQPVLRLAAQREMRGEKVRLVEIEPDAAVERRPARVRASQPRVAEEVHVVIFGVHPRLFFRPVPDAEVDALVLAFGDRDPDRHLGRLQLRD